MNLRHLRHTPTCATGARAEKRGACDCGAHERPPAWTACTLGMREANGTPLIEVKAIETLTAAEAGMLALAIQDCTRECGQRFASYQAGINGRSKS